MIFLAKRLLSKWWRRFWCGGHYTVAVAWPEYTILEDTERIIAEFKAEMERLELTTPGAGPQDADGERNER